jgi:adenosine kinase
MLRSVTKARIGKGSHVRIVVTGSLAFDYIMTFPGHFKDHILADKAHTLSVSFLVDSMQRMRGGVAGNVAYTLSLFGERPLVVAAAGQDFGEYRAWMQSHGIDTSSILEVPGEFTASCFINTDLAHNHIVALYAGAMAHSRRLSIKPLGLGPEDLVVISPSDPEAMIRTALECQQLGVRYVFDPGKQVPRLEREQVLDGLRGAFLLIANDYELAMMAQRIGRSEREVISLTASCAITVGAEGSTLYSANGEDRIHIPVAPAENKDPTGAGDAYLAGLVFGIARRFPWPVAGRVASLAAAYAIEQRGCQEHRFELSEFVKRYSASFGPSPELSAYASALKAAPPAPRKKQL